MIQLVEKQMKADRTSFLRRIMYVF